MWCFVGRRGVLPRPPKTRDTRDRHISYYHNVKIFVPADWNTHLMSLTLRQHFQWHLGVDKLIDRVWTRICAVNSTSYAFLIHGILHECLLAGPPSRVEGDTSMNRTSVSWTNIIVATLASNWAIFFAKITVCLFSLQPVWVQGSVLLFLSIFCWGGWVWWSCGSHVKDKCL